MAQKESKKVARARAKNGPHNKAAQKKHGPGTGKNNAAPKVKVAPKIEHKPVFIVQTKDGARKAISNSGNKLPVPDSTKAALAQLLVDLS